MPSHKSVHQNDIAFWIEKLTAQIAKLVGTEILLAVHNGEWRGGTAATIRYAWKMGREIIAIHPVSMHITHEKITPPAA